MRRIIEAVTSAFVAALAVSIVARAQIILPTRGPATPTAPPRPHVFLPYLRRDPTPTPGPHCDLAASNDFESGMGDWTFSDAGDQAIIETDRPLAAFGPHVVELVAGEDGSSHLRSPAIRVPPIAGLRPRLDVTFSYRSLRGRHTPFDDFIATGYVRIPFRGIDEDMHIRDFDFERSALSKVWYSGGGTTGETGNWLSWPDVQVRIMAAGDGSDTRWQVDGVRVEVCYAK